MLSANSSCYNISILIRSLIIVVEHVTHKETYHQYKRPTQIGLIDPLLFFSAIIVLPEFP